MPVCLQQQHQQQHHHQHVRHYPHLEQMYNSTPQRTLPNLPTASLATNASHLLASTNLHRFLSCKPPPRTASRLLPRTALVSTPQVLTTHVTRRYVDNLEQIQKQLYQHPLFIDLSCLLQSMSISTTFQQRPTVSDDTLHHLETLYPIPRTVEEGYIQQKIGVLKDSVDAIYRISKPIRLFADVDRIVMQLFFHEAKWLLYVGH
uniref:Uncharacterized protein n=1 Tax=Lygus hesperus TaxID=30085 RepID=A0A146LVV5_LYGHE